MAALFGSSSRASGKNLLEFKAGKMTLRGQTVHPDKRKGQVYLYQADDSLMHFCWKDRSAVTGSVEEDLIIFPDDCEYKRVARCTTGRVYVLRFKSTSRRLFFWMQEPKTDKDDDHCRKVNELLNNPPTPGSRNSTGSSSNSVLGPDLSSLRDSDLQNLFSNIPHQQLMQILGNGVPSLTNLLGQSSGGSRSSSASSTGATTSSVTGSTTVTTTTTSSSTTSSNVPTATATPTPTPTQDSSQGSESTDNKSNTSAGPIQLADLKNILSGITVPADVASGASRVPGVAVDLGTAMNSEALQSILTNAQFVEQLKPFLPQTEEKLPPVEQLRGTVASPQFQQAVTTFSHALQSGQLGPLINQFGLGEEAVLAAASCDLEAFIKALEKKKDNEASAKETEKKNEKDQDKDKDDDTDDSWS